MKNKEKEIVEIVVCDFTCGRGLKPGKALQRRGVRFIPFSEAIGEDGYYGPILEIIPKKGISI